MVAPFRFEEGLGGTIDVGAVALDDRQEIVGF